MLIYTTNMGSQLTSIVVHIVGHWLQDILRIQKSADAQFPYVK